MTKLSLLKQALEKPLHPCQNPDNPKEWARLGFHVAFKLVSEIRTMRLHIRDMQANFKSDGSPFTQFEQSIEDFCKKTLEDFYPEAGFFGEESGNTHQVKPGQILFLIDPIDGTRSFLSGFDSFALTLGIIEGEKTLFSLICNPATSDIIFRIGTEKSTLLSLPIFSGEMEMAELPLLSSRTDQPILVNLHPARASEPYIQKLYTLWNEQKIAMVKSVSGSPSWQIMEACKGDVVYFNTWSEGITMPFDLVAALHILEGSSGFGLGMNGKKINPWDHKGGFMVGQNKQHLNFLLEQVG